MMDHISSGTNPHPSSGNANTSSSSVIVQQSSGNPPTVHPSSVNSSGEVEGLGNVQSSSGHNNTSTTTTGYGSSQELTPVQQQRIISTTQQHLSTPSGPGSAQSPVLSPSGKLYGRNYNGTSE